MTTDKTTSTARIGLELREPGIAWLTLGDPAAPGPPVGSRLLAAQDAGVAEIEDLGAVGAARAVVIRGAAPGAFVSGTDADELREFADGDAAVRAALAAQRVLRRLEELPVPTIAVVDGPCFGSGLEVALACSYRLASDAASTRMGMPQVRVGLIPALGGTVRLPRLVGLEAALELILTGRSIDASEALELGVVDEVVPARSLESTTARFTAERIERGRLRGRGRRRMARRLLEDTAPGRRVVLARSARRHLRRLEYAAPAPTLALEAVAVGLTLPLERAFLNEAEVAGRLLVSERARALLYASRLLTADGRDRDRPSPGPAPARSAVLGAGAVGSGLAYLLASAELPVLLKEPRREVLLRGSRHVANLLSRDHRVGRIAAADVEVRGAFVESGTGFGGFGTVDLVVAAVGRDADDTANALREAEEHVRDDCVLASSALVASPARIQEAVRRPERVVGLRFARPLDLYPLLEIVTGPATDARTVESCIALARRLGRVPLVVADRPDTPGLRLLGIHLAEALRLLEDGASVSEVDDVAEALGLVLGPFRRMDALGIARSVQLLEHLGEACGERMRPGSLHELLDNAPPLFHRYRNGLPTGPNPGLPPSGADRPPAAEIRSRLLLSLVNEAARLLEERPDLDPEAVDRVSLAGLGFPRTDGGLLLHADRTGLPLVVEQLRELQRLRGERFAPAPLLQRLGAEDRGFFPRRTGQGMARVLR